MEDTMQQYWAEEYERLVAEGLEYSAYMQSLVNDRDYLLTDIKVLNRLLEEKYIQLKRIESQLL